MAQELPLVVSWDTFPRDNTEPIKLFEHSQFNYFLRDQEAGVVGGFWEVEDGGEIMGDEPGGRKSNEILVVLEGKLFVRRDDGSEQTALPGDVVVVLRNHKTVVRVEERTRAFFIVWRTDPSGLVDLMDGKGDASQLPKPYEE